MNHSTRQELGLALAQAAALIVFLGVLLLSWAAIVTLPRIGSDAPILSVLLAGTCGNLTLWYVTGRPVTRGRLAGLAASGAVCCVAVWLLSKAATGLTGVFSPSHSGGLETSHMAALAALLCLAALALTPKKRT